MKEPAASREFRYDAFILYCHHGDAYVAPAIQKALRRFGKPWYVPSSIRICRDDTSLGLVSDLPAAIRQRLEQSRCLILLACPEAAKSKWVEEEIRYWLQYRTADTLLIVLTGGELAWAEEDFDGAKSTALPPALKNAFKAEPLWADLRPAKADQDLTLGNPSFSNQIVKIIAALRRVSVEVVRDEVAEQERSGTRKFRSMVVGLGVLALAVLCIGLLIVKITKSVSVWRSEREAARKEEANRIANESLRKAAEAERRKEAASSATLAAKAEAVLSDDRELSTLLAVQAVEIFHTPEAEHALRRSLLKLAEPLVLRGHSEEVLSAQFTPDGRQVLTSSADQTVRLWDAATGSNILTLTVNTADSQRQRTPPDYIGTLSPDGTRILTMVHPKSLAFGYWESPIPLRVYETATGRLLATITDRYSVDAAISPNNKQIITAGFNTKARIWAIATEKVQFELEGHEQRIASASFSSNGKWALTASWDGTARVWEAATGRNLAILASPSKQMVEAAAFSPDGDRVLTLISERADQGKSLEFWDWLHSAGGRLALFEGHGDSVTDFTFSRDGKVAVTSSSDNTAKIWSTADGKCLMTLRGHNEQVTGVDISPNGRWIVTASYDKSAYIWDASTGEKLMPLGWNHSARTCVAFSPDGKHIITGTADGNVPLYTYEICGSVEDLRRLARSRLTRELTSAERQKYLAEPQGN